MSDTLLAGYEAGCTQYKTDVVDWVKVRAKR